MEVTAHIVPGWLDYLTLIVGAVTLFIVLLAWRQLRSMEKARHSQALLHFREVWDSPRLLRARQAVNNYDEETLAEAIDTADRENSEEYFTLIAVAEFFEDLALARYRHYVSEEDIWLKFSPSISHYYRLYRKRIEQMRKKEPKELYSSVYAGFEQLYKDYSTKEEA